ncbi:hypothetical protein C3K47_14115 [Solitalea longa]|uniref:Uncharacterized protein n=1 Tax=Solitalea longa TaxID=2079460 RepID=A0A2S5A0P0_9SPHI|nr:hypothetical protein [Solitalea longa]POY35879.1 hypothetical protein C3K47_14115 [Solitalea longa]
MKTINKVSFNFNYLPVIAPILLLFLILINPYAPANALPNNLHVSDSTLDHEKIREVLTSQQLFVVEAKPNGKNVKFKAELRDAYKIIKYDKDSSSIELNWTMCTKNCCPQPGFYSYGTTEYKKLDTLIKAAIIGMPMRK